MTSTPQRRAIPAKTRTWKIGYGAEKSQYCELDVVEFLLGTTATNRDGNGKDK
jgi:hypothetical protein